MGQFTTESTLQASGEENLRSDISVDTEGFEKLGVPSELVEEIARRRYPRHLEGTTNRFMGLYLLFLVVGMVGVLISAIVAKTTAQSLSTSHLNEPFVYIGGFAPSILLWMFTWCFTAGWFAHLSLRLGGSQRFEYASLAFIEQAVDGVGTYFNVARSWYRIAFRGLASVPAEKQMNELQRRCARLYLIPMVPLLVVTVIFSALDLSYYDLATTKGARVGNYFTLSGESYGWEQAQAVEVRCVMVEGEARTRYEVKLPDSKHIRLLEDRPRKDELLLLEAIDEQLIRQGAKKVYGQNDQGQPHFEAECPKRLMKTYGRGTATRVLRLVTPVTAAQ